MLEFFYKSILKPIWVFHRYGLLFIIPEFRDDGRGANNALQF